MNKFASHIFVIPEDEADQQIANGFALHDRVDSRRIQIMPCARGWSHVLMTFQEEYIPRLRRYPDGHVVMLIDFDGQVKDRMMTFQQAVPDDLKDRVFMVGCSTTPESLRAALSLSLEQIGSQLAEDCARGGVGLWQHEQLLDNSDQRLLLARVVQPFLFS